MGTGIYTGNEVYWPWWDQWGEGTVDGGGSEWVRESLKSGNKNFSFPSWQYVIFVITTYPDMREAVIL
jgi:hypothetical protein